MGCTGTWGCSCPVCEGRQHPLDRMTRFSAEQIAEITARRPEIPSPEYRMLCHCGQPGKLYARGRYCRTHAPAQPRPLFLA